MAKGQSSSDVFKEWFDYIDAQRRVKSVCKPCWEIKYCPYGSLVEQFPLGEQTDKSCRIFGHDCPVFHVAEPFTETKELRNISRTIPRPVQFRVLKRENQVCRQCTNPVRDDDIHFDHIIPWSKGGSSDEHNIQLLCGSCNRKKSDKFEAEHLVSSFRDHVVKPVGVDVLGFLFLLAGFSNDFKHDHDRLPTADDLATELNQGAKTFAEERGATIIQDLHQFFTGRRPEELSAKTFKALRLRWGFDGQRSQKLKAAASKSGIDPMDLMSAEISLIERLGWRVALDAKETKKWLRT